MSTTVKARFVGGPLDGEEWSIPAESLRVGVTGLRISDVAYTIRIGQSSTGHPTLLWRTLTAYPPETAQIIRSVDGEE